MLTFRDDIKLQVQQATDLVRLIGEQIALRPRGKEFIGLCPFHDDKNPSMYVSPAKQIYKCFSCGAGGDAFSFIMNYHKMSFPEALRHLAERAGIALQDLRSDASSDPDTPSPRQKLLNANAQALSFFQAIYQHPTHGTAARAYTQQRNISADMIQAFQLGYAPDRWDGLVLTLNDRRWNPSDFEQAGLISQRQRDSSSSSAVVSRQAKSSYYDRFRHRLIFPICDALGRPIAFGGRKLRAEDEPKYLNSPESPIFNKSATLYGLHLAKKPIIDSRTAIIVEGYTDVIACHQHGVKNVVATLGTALTPQHITELRRYAEKVILIYDGDTAGIKASDRAVEIFLSEGLDVAIAILPNQLDPADLLNLPDGLAQWQSAVQQATDALEYQFQRVQQNLQQSQTLTGKQKIAQDYLQRLANLGLGHKNNPINHITSSANIPSLRRALIIQRLSSLLHIAESEVNEILSKLSPIRTIPTSDLNSGYAQNTTKESSTCIACDETESTIKALQTAERQIIGSLLHQPQLFGRVTVQGRTLDEALTPGELITPLGRQLYDALYQKLTQNQNISLASFLTDLAQANQHDLANLATSAEAEIHTACADNHEHLTSLFLGAVQAILAFHQEKNYQQQRRHLLNTHASDSPDSSLPSDRLLQHLRDNPSPKRIPRLKPPSP